MNWTADTEIAERGSYLNYYLCRRGKCVVEAGGLVVVVMVEWTMVDTDVFVCLFLPFKRLCERSD